MAIQIDGDSGISGVNGSATTPALQGTDSNTGIVFGTDEVQIATGGSTRATVDSSGHLGLGTTSPAALGGDGGRVLHLAGANNPEIVLERTTSGTEFKSSIRITDGENTTFCVKDGSASSINAMSIDRTGRLFVGTTSEVSSNSENILQIVHADGPSLILGRNDTSVTNGNLIGGVRFFANDPSGYNQVAAIVCDADGAHASGDYPTRLEFYTIQDGAGSLSERLRIENNGRSMFFAEEAVTYIRSSAGAGTTHALITGVNGSDAVVLRVWTNGNIQNTNNSYGSLSDSKLKENIVDANSQWEDIKAIQVRNYNFKEDTGHPTHTQIGVVAQEVETVSPGLVYDTPDTDDEGNDLGTVTKSVNYSVLYMKAVKALQEAQTRIETLETQHADLLARVTALEAA